MARASLVLPLLRQRDAWLERCVRSALEQTVSCETLVVVSRHTPASNLSVLAALRDAHPALRVLPRDRDGFAAAINTGIRRAFHDRVGLLLTDDWLDPGTVEACLAHDADIVSTGMTFWAADGATRLDRLVRMPRRTVFDGLPNLESRASYLSHFFLFRRARLLDIGGVDETIGTTGADDYDMVWCLLERGASVGLVGRGLYNYRDHDGERLTLRAREAQVADLIKILDKHGVPKAEQAPLIARKAVWYGQTTLSAAETLARRAQGGP
jgi:chondroitin synthase